MTPATSMYQVTIYVDIVDLITSLFDNSRSSPVLQNGLIVTYFLEMYYAICIKLYYIIIIGLKMCWISSCTTGKAVNSYRFDISLY